MAGLGRLIMAAYPQWTAFLTKEAVARAVTKSARPARGLPVVKDQPARRSRQLCRPMSSTWRRKVFVHGS